MELRPYQQAAVNAVYQHLRERNDNPCVVLPTGTGKSVVIAQIATDAVKLWDGRVLVLAHVKELLEQNSAKVAALCPDIPVGLFSAGLKSRDTREPVIVAGIQSVYDKACDLGAFDLVIVDECFPAGTLIDTPRGQISIEELYVGQPVRHALGVGNIEAISSRPTFEIIKLELSNGRSIECTPNHPFFTESGWCAASSLAVGARLFSRENVSGLRQGISSERMVRAERETDQVSDGKGMDSSKILFATMRGGCKKSSKRKPSGIGEGCHGSTNMGTASEDGGKSMSLLRQGISPALLSHEADVRRHVESARFLLNILLQESRESDVSAGCREESVCEIEGNRSQTVDSRREWESVTFAAGTTGATIGSGNGISGHDNGTATPCRSVALLQTGCGNPVSPSRDTTRRRESLCEENPQNGQTDSCLDGGIRVVGITHIKLKSPRTVYNLQVAGHPSYFADGVLVHNCHLIAPDGDGMYRTFLEDMLVVNPNVRLIGMTATPFRLKGGLICKPENLLNHICYEAGLKEMIAQGYLSPLVSRAGRAEAKLDDLHIRGGEFIADEAAAAMDQHELVMAACREIIDLTRDRKSVLIFCASVEHCNHVAAAISSISGNECAIVTGNTSAVERAEILARFRGEQVPDDFFSFKQPLKFLANVNVLTTGFDAPNTDCVVLLRPTNSAGLLIQMVGRGTRLSPATGKSNCLVLDYGGNIMRHGPIDMIEVKEPGSGKGGEAPAKTCPECRAIIHAAYAKCPECGYDFPPPEKGKHGVHAATDGILSGQVSLNDYDVHGVYYAVHTKRNALPDNPKTMRVDYCVGFGEYKSEWVCPEHSGYARDKFVKWWRERAVPGLPVPTSAEEAVRLAQNGALAEPEQITVRSVSGDTFDRISGYKLGPVPEYNPAHDLYDGYTAEPGEAPSGSVWDPDDDDGIPF